MHQADMIGELNAITKPAASSQECQKRLQIRVREFSRRMPPVRCAGRSRAGYKGKNGEER